MPTPLVIPPTVAVLDDSGENTATVAASENSATPVDDGVNAPILVDDGVNAYEIATDP